LPQLVQRLRSEVATWRELAPAVCALRAPELRDRHWDRAQDLLGARLARGGQGVTLAALVGMQVGGGEPSATAWLRLARAQSAPAIAVPWAGPLPAAVPIVPWLAALGAGVCCCHWPRTTAPGLRVP
jgi:hypothetical protein